MDHQELPECVIYKGNKVFIHLNDIVSGFVGNNFQNDDITLFSLEGAMLRKVSKQMS